MDWLIVDWLILVLVTPVVIVAVVLLYGFAGCGSFESAPSPTPAPSQPTKPDQPKNLVATAAGPKAVNVSWEHSAGGGVKFTLVRRLEGSTQKETFDNLAGNTFPDTMNLEEGTTYRYTVTAFLPGLPSDDSDDYLVTTLPEAPVDIQAIPEDVNRIDVKWTNKSGKAPDVIIKIDNAQGGGSTNRRAKGSGELVPQTVEKGSTNEIRVFAVMKGRRGNDEVDIKSLEMPAVIRKPLAFKTELTTEQAPAFENPAPGGLGYCIVQRIESTLLENSGKPIRLWVSGSKLGPLAIDKIYISQQAPGGDAWDSDPANITKVMNSISTPQNPQPDPQLLLPAGNPPNVKPLDVDYFLDKTKELLIAFDISPTAGRCLYNPNLKGATLYFKAQVQQAAMANRSPNATDATLYGKADERHYIVHKIEVF